MAEIINEWNRVPPTPGIPLLPGQVHVWLFCTELTALQTEQLKGALSADEMERASHFHFEKDSIKYMATRGFLRQVLAGYLGVNPHEIRFTYSERGKPALAPGNYPMDIRFNLSHAGDYALFAAAIGCDIGIDIEYIRRDIAFEEISRRFFSLKEIHTIEQTQIDQRNQLFFRYWTRKESLLKAIGRGISFPMQNADVSCVNGAVLSPVIITGTDGVNEQWFTQDLFPAPGYIAAIATGNDYCRLCFYQFSM